MVTTKFHSKYDTKSYLELETVLQKELFIHFTYTDSYGQTVDTDIAFDKPTAIKFSKELRKQIARIDDEEGI